MSNRLKENNFWDGIDFKVLNNFQFMRTDIYEMGNNYIIDIEIPGLKKDNISVDYDNGYITVSATKIMDEKMNDKYIRRVRFVGNIKRSFYIGEKKESFIRATYDNGILSISFPKEEDVKKSKKIIAINQDKIMK